MLQQACNRLVFICNRLVFACNRLGTGRLQARSSLLQADYRRKHAGCRPITDENKPVADENRLDRACNRLNVDAIKMVWERFKMVFMRKRMVESPFQRVLRCFENVLRRNVPTSGSREPDVGTFLHNRCWSCWNAVRASVGCRAVRWERSPTWDIDSWQRSALAGVASGGRVRWEKGQQGWTLASTVLKENPASRSLGSLL